MRCAAIYCLILNDNLLSWFARQSPVNCPQTNCDSVQGHLKKQQRKMSIYCWQGKHPESTLVNSLFGSSLKPIHAIS